MRVTNIYFTKTILALALLFSFLFTHGQTSIGLKAGGQLATWDADLGVNTDLNNSRTKIGYHFGVFVEIKLNSLLSLQPEFNYIEKGTRIILSDSYFGSNSNEIAESKYIYFFNYYELPLLLKLTVRDLEKSTFFLTAGPSFGYLDNGRYEFTYTANGETEIDIQEFEFEDEDGVDRFEISAAFGAGVGFPLGFGRLTFETRYLLGLSNLINENDFNDDSINNRGLGITLGYMIPLGKKNKKDK